MIAGDASARLVRIRQAISGWVFPPTCAGCDRPIDPPRQIDRPFLCEPCEAALTPMTADACRVCGQVYGDGGSGLAGATFRCANCAGRDLSFDFAVSAYRSCGRARELMHAFKYGRRVHLARLWGSLLERVWEDPRLGEVEGWRLVPVPLHRKRLRQRGFNQSREIAVEFARRSRGGVPLDLAPSLKRTKATVRQARLDRGDRLRNLEGVFSSRGNPVEVRGGWGVLVVDDVMTTGTTASECAAVIREGISGDVPVAAITVLRG